jgi:hypothetical protein
VSHGQHNESLQLYSWFYRLDQDLLAFVNYMYSTAVQFYVAVDTPALFNPVVFIIVCIKYFHCNYFNFTAMYVGRY